eukprot:1194510-Prorocentrum_minimum.AAC.7
MANALTAAILVGMNKAIRYYSRAAGFVMVDNSCFTAVTMQNANLEHAGGHHLFIYLLIWERAQSRCRASTSAAQQNG